MTLPDWLLPTFLLLPALLWMFLGVGLPWARALLPRSDWCNRVTVIGVALALGPAMTTTAMFLIGTFGQFSIANVLVASVLVAGIGAILAARDRSPKVTARIDAQPLTVMDITLIAVAVVALVIRFWNTAYWPYTTYDEFWVYGYNAKMFMRHSNIPTSIGYYPQLIPLAYTFGQLMWGELNDHAARTVVPIFALASILMAYLLGSRLFNRRVGLLTAAMWALFPQHTAWSQFGDLEVPITLYFTATALFFVLGWRERKQRYIILSGVFMGAALWTKPTAFALPESLVLIAGVWALFVLWSNIRRNGNNAKPLTPSFGVAWWFVSPTSLRPQRPPLPRKRGEGLVVPTGSPSPRTERGTGGEVNPAIRYPLLALMCAAPMGGMWYIRNILYGHDPIVLPQAYWQSAAQRSGMELGWPLLIALALTALLVVKRQRISAALGGMLLLLVGSLPSAFGGRLPTYGELSQLAVGLLPDSLTPYHLGIVEFAIIGVGVALLAWAAFPLWQKLADKWRATGLLLVAFIGPYFVTWFWSYSYHPRLSFAIVPLLIVLFAAVLDALRTALAMPATSLRLRRFALSMIIIALALPGYAAGLTALEPAVTGSLPDDHAKYTSGNPALMALVDYLHWRKDPNHRPVVLNRPLVVSAPAELRLPFFFPLDDIRTDYPIALDQIADVDYFVDSSVGQRLYNINDQFTYNQILASLTRQEVMQRAFTVDDGNFRFSAYTLQNQQRFAVPSPNGPINLQVGDFALLYGYDIGTTAGIPTRPFLLTLYWKALRPADLDYSVFIYLWDTKANKAVGVWGGEPVSGAWSVWYLVKGAHFDLNYHTRLWQAGETIKDEWRIIVPNAPPGIYELRLGMIDPGAQKMLPVTRDGTVIGDWIELHPFTILSKKS